jgi:(1->4)-alpha-D-glucan 1-alpha-D-glucosylmutase
MRTPVSTYRLQITAEHTLDEAVTVLPYLHRLGVDWVYLSPLLKAHQGSDHGYDVVDHGVVDESRGGEAGLRALADAAHALGMKVLVDIVPNHVGVDDPTESQWWWDVLQHGRGSRWADAFDIDWAYGQDKINLPVLGDGADELDHLEVVDGELHYYDHRFPIAPGTEGGSPREVLERQHYRLLDWHLADTELDYRRFFAVNSLAAIRVEDPAVFEASHREPARWIDQGWVDGLRVDHPDGLADPEGYLARLSELIGGRYILAEKILEPGERLPADWACDGTTGYDALAVVDRVLTDPAGEKTLTQLDTELRGGAAVHWHDMTVSTKTGVATGLMQSEVRRLAALLPDIPNVRAGLIALLAEFGVYRSYLPAGRKDLDAAAARAVERHPELGDTVAAVVAAIRPGGSEAATRFEQVSGAVTAKGVEDCAFYRWTRLTSLTEVGGDPSVFAVDVDGFHAAQQDRLTGWPAAMTTLSTHDTKRSEDVRARITVLAELPEWWAEQVRALLATTPLADGPLANLVFQAAVGSWPIEQQRLADYAQKAAREAGVSTGWQAPDETFEAALTDLVAGLYDASRNRPVLDAAAARITPAGWSNSLVAKALQLGGPGVPDVYQGSEIGTNTLVDPDNRLPVDHAVAAQVLDDLDSGAMPGMDDPSAAKLLVTATLLRLRRDRPELFGRYLPLTGDGPAGDHLVGFDRGGVVVLGTRLPVGLAARGGWADTTVTLPRGRWVDALRPGTPELSGTVELGDLFAVYPVVVAVRQETT